MPQDYKINQFVNMKIPVTKKELRSSLGVVSFYRRFIRDFSTLSCNLTELLKNKSKDPLVWNGERIGSFKKVIIILTNLPILHIPDADRPFILRTDESDVGLGAALMQRFDDGMFPVAFASNKLLDREVNYSTEEKECLGIVWAVNRFRFYMYGREFLLQTDHRPLSFLKNLKDDNQRLMRLALQLQTYKFKVEYIKGTENREADLLSRLSV